MTKREIALMGYIGEAVVEQWLHYRYPAPEHQVVAQIIPSAVSQSGGGYLDFGIIRNGVVEAVYEVKSQDYIFDKSSPSINKALAYIWDEEKRPLKFKTQDREELLGSLDTQAFLVLLAAPNPDGIQRIGRNNLRYIVLFQDIWAELENKFDIEALRANFEADAKKVISILRQPSQGKLFTPFFLELRARTQS